MLGKELYNPARNCKLAGLIWFERCEKEFKALGSAHAIDKLKNRYIQRDKAQASAMANWERMGRESKSTIGQT